MVNIGNFESLKNSLIAQLYELDDKSDFVPESFRQRFFKLLQDVIFSLMEGPDSFFALFTIQMKRDIKMNLETAVDSKPEGTYFSLYFNPWIFLNCTFKEMQALLKHEVYHIMSLHHLRAEELRKRYSTLAVNLAMDISINQYIMNLPVWSESLETVRLSYNVDLKEEMLMEQYAYLIQNALNRLKKDKDSKAEVQEGPVEYSEPDSNAQVSHNIEGAHDLWFSSDSTADKEQIKEIIRKTANSASKGKMPGSIESLFISLNKKPEITWSSYLKKLMGTLPSGHKKTITRKNRRQPDRMDLRGRLSMHTAEIVAAIDISGSVTDKEIEKIMTEIFSIVKNYPHKLTVVECDSEIRRVYEARTIKDIKQKLNTKGATKFSPVFRYLKDKNKKNCVLLYFTDGLGETELDCLPYHFKTLWVLTGKEERLSVSKPYGAVKRLTGLKAQTSALLAIEYLKDELKDIRSEWAK